MSPSELYGTLPLHGLAKGRFLSNPLLLYSTNTRLAYLIGQRYYGRRHYVWCTPHFDASNVPSVDYTVPPSSSPALIYRTLVRDVRDGDHHSAAIDANKAGILKGVQAKRTAGAIDDKDVEDIASIVEASELRDFSPLIFVMPYDGVESSLAEVPVAQRAHPLSVEFIIEALPRKMFDIIDP